MFAHPPQVLCCLFQHATAPDQGGLLQGPSGPAADAAVAALKAEVRCIRHSSVRASMGRGLAASLAACREGLQAQLAQDNHVRAGCVSCNLHNCIAGCIWKVPW